MTLKQQWIVYLLRRQHHTGVRVLDSTGATAQPCSSAFKKRVTQRLIHVFLYSLHNKSEIELYGVVTTQTTLCVYAQNICILSF